MQPENVGPPNVEMEIQCAALEVANRLVIELAADVALDVEHDESHDLVVDAALAGVDGRPNARVDVGGDHAARPNRLELDEWTRRLDRMESVAAGG